MRERDRESVRNNFGRLKPDVSFVVASAPPWSSFFIFQERNKILNDIEHGRIEEKHRQSADKDENFTGGISLEEYNM